MADKDGYSILVVDDEWLIRELMESVFKLNGYQVTLAASGEQALQLARENPPDVVLLDVRMQDMDGFAVCRALRDDPRTQKAVIVMMSGLEGTRAERSEALEAGADDFITRSIQNQALVAHITTLLEDKQP